jgi:hypothetical protein
MLDALAECGIARETGRRRENGGTLYEEGYIKALLGNGWEACGCSAGRTDDTLRVATQDGLLTKNDFDDWVSGMRSGSGMRTYYGLTFKGKKQAERASVMPPVAEAKDDEMRQDCGVKQVGAERTESSEREQDEGNGEVPPSTGATIPAMMSVEAALRLCRAKPNEAFFYWKALESRMPAAGSVQAEKEGAAPELAQVLGNWFERCGHWRDLKVDASTATSDGVARPSGLHLIREFVRSRRAKVQYVDYDEVQADHVRKESEKEYSQYTWTYVLAGEPQVILQVDDPDAPISTAEAHYLSKSKPSGYSYWIESEEIALREVCVYFPKGACMAFLCGFNGSIYPEDGIVEGDYELRRVGERQAAQNAKANKPAAMEPTAILELCAISPNRAFLHWQSFEEDLSLCPHLGLEDERKFRAMRDTFREWFEDLGHWRDLRPNAKDLDPDDHNAHAKHQKQIKEFMTARRSRIRHIIEYDDVRKAHGVQHEGTEHENVEYNWEFFRDGVSQLILRTAGGNVLPPHRDPLKRQYFKNTPPSGYAILEFGNRLEGSVFFPNGDSYGFDPCFGDENRFYPDELFQAGDYELRKVGKKGSAIDQSIAKHTALIPDILQKVEGTPQKTAALLRGTIKQRLGTIGTVVEEDFSASPHFTNLTWRGNQYVLRATAAIIIETLYIAQKDYGIPGFRQDEVFGQVYGSNKKDWPSGNTRIQNFFRTGDAKRLWKDGCITHDGKGNFRLNIKIHT